MTEAGTDAHEEVRSTYSEVAQQPSDGKGCCPSATLYPEDVQGKIPEGAELGLGTGTPVQAADPRPGETVVDLGCGAGVDVFLAAQAVGASGRAIGVDVTPEMVDRARELADREGIDNVAFHVAPIEELPLDDGIADVVVSNCVINLSDDKRRVLEEALRVLRPGGRFVVSDTVRVDGGPVEHPGCGCACSTGALTAEGWRELLGEAGFETIAVDAEPPDGRFGHAVGTARVRARKPR